MIGEFVVGGLLVVLGFCLGLIPPWLNRQRRMKLHWQALRAENLIAIERVTEFLNENIAAPLYRLPLRAYDAALKALLHEAANLTPDKLKVLYEAADLIGDINRGLDYCADLANNDAQAGALAANDQRNRMKAERLRAVVLPAVTRLVHEKLSMSG